MDTKPLAQSPSFAKSIQFNETAEDGLDIRQLVAAIRRKALLIFGITAVVASAAVVKTLLDPPIYSGEFEILVQPTSAESEVLSSVPETLSSKTTTQQTPDQEFVTKDQLRILTSPRVLMPVVKKLRANYPGVCRTLATEQDIDASTSLSDDTCYRLLLTNFGIDTISEKESRIVKVTYQASDAEAVQAVLKLTSEAYLQYSLDSRQVDIRRAIDFVNKKLPDLRRRVETLQTQLEQLRRKNDLIDPQSQGEQLSTQVSAFQQQQLETQVDIRRTQELYSDLRSQLTQQSTESAASSALTNNPHYQDLLKQLLDVDGKIAQTSTLFRDDSPDMQVLRDQRQNVLRLLAKEGQRSQREVVSQLMELEAREDALRQTLGSLNSNVRNLAGISHRYTDIERELQVSTEALNQFLAKQQALQIDSAQRQVPWEMIAPPGKPDPSNPGLLRNLALGIILGLLLGTGAALLVGKLTDVIYAPDELKRIAKLPLLGAIPRHEALDKPPADINLATSLQQARLSLRQLDTASEPAIARLDAADTFLESFRSLFTNICLINSDNPIRAIAISSVMPGDGKSIAAAYLAEAAAAMGRQVLLVDANFRQPRLHMYFDLPNANGLTDILFNNAVLKTVVQRSPVEPNLFVLTTGPIPPDPTRALSSQKMQHLMEQIQTNFDFVIYDTPTLLNFADPYLVAAHTDGIVLVTQPGKVRRSTLDQTLEQTRVSNISVLGIVLQKLTGLKSG
jgi:capsular exopolysaccharide synthesis family protein